MTKKPSPQETQWPIGAVFTVGHSTLPIERFAAMLHAYGIECLADIRTVPRSRHNPQFNSEELGEALKKENIDYVLLQALGGLRHPRKDSINTGWRNKGFRGYADYMQTPAFRDGLEALIARAATNAPPSCAPKPCRGAASARWWLTPSAYAVFPLSKFCRRAITASTNSPPSRMLKGP